MTRLGESHGKLAENPGESGENHGKLAERRGELGEYHGKVAESHGELGEYPGKLAVILSDVGGRVLGMEDYSLEDLVRLSGYSARGIRHYIQLGLLARPKVKGRATRYPRETLGRLSAIRVWRDNDGLSVARIKRELRKLEPEEVQSWADVLELPQGPAAPDVGPLAPPRPEASSAKLVGDRWLRLPLVPGLDLMMREVAGEDVIRLAAEIQAKYGAGAQGRATASQ